MATAFLRVFRFLENLFDKISWRFENLADGLDSELQTEVRHHLKTWPPYFQMILDGSKTFDLRKNDRNFQEGDCLVLEEYLPDEGRYTGRVITRKVGSVVYGQWGLKEGMCAMSLLPMVGL